MSIAKTDIPERETYSHVCIQPILEPKTEQSFGFYDGIVKSRNIEYKGKNCCLIFLSTHSQMRNLFYQRKGWLDITEEWFQYLDEQEKKSDTIVLDEPIKTSRGRPRAKTK